MAYYFHVKMKISWDIQDCISAPLILRIRNWWYFENEHYKIISLEFLLYFSGNVLWHIVQISKQKFHFISLLSQSRILCHRRYSLSSPVIWHLAMSLSRNRRFRSGFVNFRMEETFWEKSVCFMKKVIVILPVALPVGK